MSGKFSDSPAYKNVGVLRTLLKENTNGKLIQLSEFNINKYFIFFAFSINLKTVC